MEFISNDTKMSAELFLPANYQPSTKLPSILVVGPWLNVKEQVARNYARRLAEKGFAALTFDFRHWGRSGGEPREYESPSDKIQDIHNALQFMSTLPEVDSTRIGALGVCFGVGYVAAAASERLLKSIATVAAWVHDVPSITALVGEAEVIRRRAVGRAAMDDYKKTGTVRYVPAGSSTDKTAAMYSPDPDSYYNSASRGAIPEWTNQFAVMGWEQWLDFDGVIQAAHITQPLLVVHSDGSALPENAKRFVEGARGPKELLWMEGEHTQFYDTTPQIDRAVDAVAAHFGQTLLSETSRQQISQRAIASTHEFFAALEASDIPRFLGVWSEEGIQEMPYAPQGFPSRLVGKKAIEKQYGPLSTAFDGMAFPIKSLRASADPNTVIAEFEGSIKLKAEGRYDNQYVGVFTFDSHGKLALYREYFDPFVLLQGFPGAAQMGPEGPKEIVKNLPLVTDARDWATLEKMLAPKVFLDYTSLEGGEPRELTSSALVDLWRSNLTRFISTKHDFSTPEVEVTGDSAIATFTGQATHLHQGIGTQERWNCGGDYTYKFERTPQGWRVTAMRFAAKWQQGAPWSSISSSELKDG